jgi:tetratricopeptide (TPR) repeat protein
MRKLWLIVGALAVAGVAVAVWQATRPQWTTTSRAALAEYLAGRQAQMKLYSKDAATAFHRALALDPQFVAAKIGLLDSDIDKAERERLVAELRAADRSRLNDRERFLLDVVLAAVDHDPARRGELTAAYLERHPRDPWALQIAAGDAWARQDWAESERVYRRLLEVNPNWLLARNILGYIAMAQGRFREAEDEFRTYRFAAPDQANPHDSLGELLVLLGRYDEARAELEEALRIKPDFCASYDNLMRIAVLDRRPDDLEPLLGRVERNCPEAMAARMRCAVVVARAFLTGDDDAPWRDPEGPCKGMLDQPEVLVHMLAVRSGRLDAALAMEKKMEEQVAESGKAPEQARKNARMLARFFVGQRLSAEGHWAEAIPALREVEADSNWWGAGGIAIVKLVARLELARAQAASGDEAGARETLNRLRAVNPSFAGWFDTFHPLEPHAGLNPPTPAGASAAPRP